MRPVIASLLALIVLLGQLPLRLATHWCQGKAVETQVVWSGQTALNCPHEARQCPHGHDQSSHAGCKHKQSETAPQESGCAHHPQAAEASALACRHHSAPEQSAHRQPCAHSGIQKNSVSRSAQVCFQPESGPCCEDQFLSLEVEEVTPAVRTASVPLSGLLFFVLSFLMDLPAAAARCSPFAVYDPPHRRPRNFQTLFQVFRQ